MLLKLFPRLIFFPQVNYSTVLSPPQAPGKSDQYEEKLQLKEDFHGSLFLNKNVNAKKFFFALNRFSHACS